MNWTNKKIRSIPGNAYDSMHGEFLVEEDNGIVIKLKDDYQWYIKKGFTIIGSDKSDNIYDEKKKVRSGYLTPAELRYTDVLKRSKFDNSFAVNEIKF